MSRSMSHLPPSRGGCASRARPCCACHFYPPERSSTPLGQGLLFDVDFLQSGGPLAPSQSRVPPKMPALVAAPELLYTPANWSQSPIAERPMSEVTRILSAIEQGDEHAAEQLLPLVYPELRKLAAQRLAQEKPGQTLQATALVHEAYLRLVDVKQAQHWNSRGHFFAAC